MTGSSSDTAVFTAGTNGTLSIVTTDDAAAAANIQITADGTVDIDSVGVLTLDSGAAINLEPAGGSAILLDGVISIDAGVVTGATSITSTNFDGIVGGNTPAAITGTTIDASTDFTIGSTVITDDLITFTPSTSDTVTLTAAANGGFSLVTTDNAGTDAYISLVANGVFTVQGITVTIDASEDLVLSADGGNVTMDDGTLTIFDFDVDNTSLTIHDDQDTGDKAVISMAQHGALSIVTTDDDAAAAHIIITADGTFEADGTTVTLDSGGDVVLDAAGGDVFFKAGGTIFGSATNTSGNLIIKSGTTTAATFAGANITLAGTVGSGAITSTGLITGVGVTSTGDFTTTGQATDWDLIDNTASALSFDASGKTGILEIDTRDGSERVAMSGDLYVAGDVEIAGSNTTFSSTVINIADPLIALATTNEANAVDIGFYGRYRTNGTNLYTGFVWDANVSKYILFHGNQAAPTTTVNTGGTGYAASTLVLGTLETTNVAAHNLTGKLTAGGTEIEGSLFDITGGNIDGTPIGAAATSTIVGTTIDATTDFTIGSTVITDDSIVMTPSTSDTATLSAATNGAFSIVTVDDAAAAANIQITADGTVDIDSAGVLTLDSGAAINLEPADGSVVLLDGTISVDAGVVTGATSITSTAFVGTLSTAAQGNVTSLGTLTALTVDDVVIDGKVITMTGSSGDTAVLTVATNGAFSLITTDAAAAAANIQITADGTVDIDSAGVLTLDSGAAINLEPAAGSAILLDGTISIDAGVVTGATSITTIDIIATGSMSFGATSFNDENLTNVGDIALDTLSSDAGAGITFTPTTDTFFSNGTGVVIGHTAQETISIDGSTDLVPELQVLGTVAADSSMMLAAFSTTATIAGSPILAFVKGGNATIGSHTVVTDGEELGNIVAYGDDGTDLESIAAQIQFEVDGTPGTGDMPGRILLATTADGAQAATERMRVDALGRVFIGDTTIGTSVDMDTPGLVINQAAGDKHILVLKSSDVAHGVTTVAETDTYGAFLKVGGAGGGLQVLGISEGLVATHIRSICTTDDTGKAASSNASIEINTQKKDGTGVAAMGSNANILAIRNNGSSRFLFDAEGDFYADASINADYYDDYNDPVLVRDLDLAITQRFDGWIQYNRSDVERAKLVHFDEQDKPFVNWTRVWKLHNGAIWQLYEKMERLEEENKSLKESLSKMLPEG
jgi:hypothetical protein